MHAYNRFELHFSPTQEQAQEIVRLEQKLGEQKIEIARHQVEMLDLQQQVARNLPALDSVERRAQNFNSRSIASVSQQALRTIDLSSSILERGKKLFREKKFFEAQLAFSELIEKYPTSQVRVEAQFFYAESLFLQKKIPECLDVIDFMMTQFPDNELTGFIMLRMGQILQAKGHGEEAIEVFRVVGQHFKENQELKKQAEKMQRSVE